MKEFWSISPSQFMKYCKVYEENEKEKIKLEEQRLKNIDTLNHQLAGYIYYAVNNPKKFPRYPNSYEPPKPKVMTAEEMEQIMMKNTIMLGGTINGVNS